MREETIKKYLYRAPKLQELEDDVNSEVERFIESEFYKKRYGMPISLHDAEILAIEQKDGTFTMRIIYGIPEYIPSDVVKECWDYKKYIFLIFDIICDGVEIVEKDEDFDRVMTTIRVREVSDETLIDCNTVRYYILYWDGKDADVPYSTDISFKFKTYRYKVYGVMKEKYYDKIREWYEKNPDIPHPLCVIDD